MVSSGAQRRRAPLNKARSWKDSDLRVSVPKSTTRATWTLFQRALLPVRKDDWKTRFSVFKKAFANLWASLCFSCRLFLAALRGYHLPWFCKTMKSEILWNRASMVSIKAFCCTCLSRPSEQDLCFELPHDWREGLHKIENTYFKGSSKGSISWAHVWKNWMTSGQCCRCDSLKLSSLQAVRAASTRCEEVLTSLYNFSGPTSGNRSKKSHPHRTENSWKVSGVMERSSRIVCRRTCSRHRSLP